MMLQSLQAELEECLKQSVRRVAGAKAETVAGTRDVKRPLTLASSYNKTPGVSTGSSRQVQRLHQAR